MRLGIIVLGLTLAAACNGGNAAPQPDGPVKMGVIAGNHQVVTAAPLVRLPSQVVVQVAVSPSGQVSLRTRIIDAALPPKAFAQATGVKGLPNQTVCTTIPDPKHALTAVVPCASSDALGNAYFTFQSDTVAGTSKAQVAASLATGIQVTDSVSADVLPGPFVDSPLQTSSWPMLPGGVAPAELALDKYNNPVPYRLVPLVEATVMLNPTTYAPVKLYAHTLSATFGEVGARTIVVDSLVGNPNSGSSSACGRVQLETAAGVVFSANLRVDRDQPGTNPRTVGILSPNIRCY
jgi:hypothetical protein